MSGIEENPLFNSNGFRQISWFINIQSSINTRIISQQLQRDYSQTADEMRIGFGNIDGKIHGILDIVISIAGQPHQIRSPGFTFRQIADRFFH